MVVAGMGAAQGPFGADLRFEATAAVWQGLGEGHGGARGRQASVQLSGRRVPRPRRAQLWLPTADGQVQAVSFAGTSAVVPAPVVPVPAFPVPAFPAPPVGPVVTLRRTG